MHTKTLVGIFEESKPLWRPKEIRYKDVDWISLTHDWVQWRGLVNTVMTLRIP